MLADGSASIEEKKEHTLLDLVEGKKEAKVDDFAQESKQRMVGQQQSLNPTPGGEQKLPLPPGPPPSALLSQSMKVPATPPPSRVPSTPPPSRPPPTPPSHPPPTPPSHPPPGRDAGPGKAMSPSSVPLPDRATKKEGNSVKAMGTSTVPKTRAPSLFQSRPLPIPPSRPPPSTTRDTELSKEGTFSPAAEPPRGRAPLSSTRAPYKSPPGPSAPSSRPPTALLSGEKRMPPAAPSPDPPPSGLRGQQDEYARRNSAIKIQKVFRGNVEARFHKAKKEAAVYIQSSVRGHLGRKHVYQTRSRSLAATSCQKLYRGRKGRQRAQIARTRREHSSASNIQRIFRGRKVRQGRSSTGSGLACMLDHTTKAFPSNIG